MKKLVQQRAMSKFSNYLGKKLAGKTILIYILSLTWGILGTLAGFFVFLSSLPFSYIQKHNGCLVLIFKNTKSDFGYGFSIGLFTFVSGGLNKRLLNHEHGHTIQNAIFGPLMPFLVLIPSVIRFHYREHLIKKNIKLTTGYDDIWFEYSATTIGEYAGKQI